MVVELLPTSIDPARIHPLIIYVYVDQPKQCRDNNKPFLDERLLFEMLRSCYYIVVLVDIQHRQFHFIVGVTRSASWSIDISLIH